MRADVAQNAAVLLRYPEPLRPAGAATCYAAILENLVRRDVDGLNHFSDGALFNEFARINSGLYFKQLAVHDGVNPFGLGNGLCGPWPGHRAW